MKVKEHYPASLNQAVAKAMRLETLYKSFEKQKETTRPRLARSTQQDRPNNIRQPETRTNNSSYNKNNGTNNETRQSPPWKNKDVEAQNKETSDLKDQVKQLSMKLSELTTKVNQPTVQQTTEAQ